MQFNKTKKQKMGNHSPKRNMEGEKIKIIKKMVKNNKNNKK